MCNTLKIYCRITNDDLLSTLCKNKLIQSNLQMKIFIIKNTNHRQIVNEVVEVAHQCQWYLKEYSF